MQGFQAGQEQCLLLESKRYWRHKLLCMVCGAVFNVMVYEIHIQLEED